MKILLTGTTGYIGKRLIPKLLELNHSLVCCVRDIERVPEFVRNNKSIQLIEVDFLDNNTLKAIPKDIDIAYYLIHSMSSSSSIFEKLEYQCAINFKTAMEATKVRQVIYLSGIINDAQLSKHLASRKNVEKTLFSDKYALTTFRAGIIVGSGSASFEIIRDLVEKLPVIIAPKWLKTKCQPIGVTDVIYCLVNVMFNKETYNKNFDIGGSDILSYEEMLEMSSLGAKVMQSSAHGSLQTGPHLICRNFKKIQ